MPGRMFLCIYLSIFSAFAFALVIQFPSLSHGIQVSYQLPHFTFTVFPKQPKKHKKYKRMLLPRMSSGMLAIYAHGKL